MKRYLLVLVAALVSCGETGDPIDVAFWDKDTQELDGPQRIIKWEDIRESDDGRQKAKWSLLLDESNGLGFSMEVAPSSCGGTEMGYELSLLRLQSDACGVDTVFAGLEPDNLSYRLPIMSCTDRVERDDGRGVPDRMMLDGMEIETPLSIGLDVFNDIDAGGDSFIGVSSESAEKDKPTHVFFQLTFYDGQVIGPIERKIPEPPIQCDFDFYGEEACGAERSPLRMRGPPRPDGMKLAPLNRDLCCSLGIDLSYPECSG